MEIGITSVGTVLNVIGSVLLAVRVKMLLKWIGLVLNAHEMGIVALMDFIERGTNRTPVITGMTEHLDRINDTTGQRLLILGFLMIGAGVICQLIGIYLKLG